LKLAVYSHKPCWRSPGSPTGYATDGGFPMQMAAISELFDETVLVVPCAGGEGKAGERQLAGHNLSVRPVDYPRGAGIARKLDMAAWTMRNRVALFGTLRWADAVHAPIPGDIGTIGMLLAWSARKPLFVRHCGNWAVQRTVAERLWRRFMETQAGGRNVMLATGGGAEPPAPRSPAVEWIFSTSLTAQQLSAVSIDHMPPSSGRLRLITVGRQEPLKGTSVVLDAMPAIIAEWPDAHLDVVGAGSAIPDLQRFVTQQELSGHVTFHGAVDHPRVIELLQSAHMLCFPTTSSEGFPKAVLEAMACGLPVVTSTVSVLPHLMAGGAGWALPDPRPSSVASAVLACAGSSEVYTIASKAAARTARQYSLEAWQATIAEALARAWRRELRCR
jgi:hypothetical protein